MAAAVGLVWSTWFASFEHRDNQWAAIVTMLIVPALWWALPKVHVRLSAIGGAWGLLLGGAIAIYGCVPETDQMREVAVVVCAGGLAEVMRRQALPSPALLASAGLVLWSALYGATGRPSALVGGLFALVAPIAVALVPGRRRWVPWAIGLVWSGAAVAVARTGGIIATGLSSALTWTAGFAMTAAAVSAGIYVVSVGHARSRPAG